MCTWGRKSRPASRAGRSGANGTLAVDSAAPTRTSAEGATTMVVEVATDYPMFIDGASVPSTAGRWLELRSPAPREVVGRVPAGTEADVELAVAAARASFRDGRWHRMLMADRVAVLNRLADLIDEHADDLARLETLQ